MTRLAFRTLGELLVLKENKPVKLPASRRTRALLAFLVLTSRPHRRDRLCEFFWEIPDDPRGALRWSLSKLRPIVNDSEHERLLADRERVSLDCSGVDVDVRSIADALEAPDVSTGALGELLGKLNEPLLDGIDLPDQPMFQEWLRAEREELARMRSRALRRLATHADLAPERVVSVAKDWCASEPFSTDAATHLLLCLQRFGEEQEVATVRREFEIRFRKAAIEWTPAVRAPAAGTAPAPTRSTTARQYQSRQRIQFCSAADGVRIAYATVGEGPPIVKAANWLSHLELDWDAPIWSPLLRELAHHHQVVRYDERGNGLSDWSVDDISLAAFVTDLETVVDTTGLESFALLGISQGAAVSIEYAVRHPRRVSRLILFGGYPAGWRIGATEDVIREREAVMTLTETGWGQDNPAYRHIFSTTFMPSATFEELTWFDDFQRSTTSPRNAARFLSAFGDIDVRDRLAQVRVPTLVLHSLRDKRIPAATGRDLAASIPNAEFLGLESDGHLLLGREPASRDFVAAVRAFLARG